MENAIYAFVALTLFGGLTCWMGYRLGVQHTEARWSDAVAKSQSARRRVVLAYDTFDRSRAPGTYTDLADAVSELKTFG